MKIREAKKEDLKQIVSILIQISKLHYEERPDVFKKKSESEIKIEAMEVINDIERKVFVATDETSKIYGVLICKIKEVNNHMNLKDSKTLWIDELGVDEKYRKNGIGKQLMEEVEKIAKELNCKRVELNCWNFNEDAIKFYQSLGMVTQRKIFEKEIGGK